MATSTASGKLSVAIIRGFSNTTVEAKIVKWTSKVSEINSKIKQTQSSIDKYKKQEDTANDTLNKKNGYKAAKAAYDHIVLELSKANKSLTSAKSSGTKKNLKAKIKTLTTQQKDAYSKLTKIASSSSYSKSAKKLTESLKKLKTLNSNMTNLKSTKTRYSGYLKMYKQVKSERDSKAEAAAKAKVAKEIQAKIKANNELTPDKKAGTGKTAIYRADKKDPTVWFLAEQEPSETDVNDIPTQPVDRGDPRARYSRRNAKTLSGTYYMFGTEQQSIDSKFNKFQKWARLGYELEVRGFSKFAHARIQEVDKNQFYGNALKMTISFTYILPQNIGYTKKKKKKTVAKKTKVTGKGSSKTSKRYVTAKAGTTYWGISQTKKVSVKSLEKMNKWPARKIPIGARVRYK
ncbi:hypothetical protein [Levilactobacillus senmaizukei]|nr:hypothetical protein [Levilactobacillus senmaizukei]